MKVKFDDLTGQRFGRLVVIKRAEDYVFSCGEKRVQWICKCDCGNIKNVLAQDLKNGNTKSCGCIRNGNTYDLSGEYGIGYTRNGEEFYFDLEDYALIKEYAWYPCKGGIHNRRIGKMHRFIYEAHNGKISDGFVIDHINGNTSDNRKKNLRAVTQWQNTLNRKDNSNNTSGVKGVYIRTLSQSQKYGARIQYRNKYIHLGIFDTIEEAAEARKQAEIKYFGEYRRKESEDA